MATTLASTLYPPQFSSTFAPAFPQDETLRVYFSISSFNSPSSIKRCHVSVVNQSSNESVLASPTGILFADLLKDTDKGMYYVDIKVTDLAGTTSKTDDDGNVVVESGWYINQYYKLQIRFDSNDFNDGTAPNTSSYFNDSTYMAHFSEWSSVVLLRPISKVSLYVEPFASQDSDSTPSFNPGILHLAGKLVFSQDNEKETMKSYSTQIVSRDGKTAYTDEETYYTGSSMSPNAIDAKVSLGGLASENESAFSLKIKATTKNDYTLTEMFPFAIGEYTVDDNFDPEFTIDTSKVDYGVVSLHLVNKRALNGGKIYITRSSSVSDFKDWETLEEIAATGTIDTYITDSTVGSGIFYRYRAQMENSGGGMTEVVYAYYQEEDDELNRKIYTVFPDFYDAYLSRMDKLVSIRYNYKVTSVKPNVSRTKMDTLGGKYPRFVQNAALNYKQFSISGLISTQADDEGMFLTKEDVFGDMLTNYEQYEESEYRDAYNIENYNYFWEREFREKLVEWLNDGEPKLYRSMTEGLLVVMLTDVSLTPNATLSRRLYEFTATMYEVADGHSLETLETLGIISRTLLEETTSTSEGDDDGDQTLYTEVAVPGQVYRVNPPSSSSAETSLSSGGGDIVAGIIDSELKKRYGGVNSSVTTYNVYLTDVKIQFLSQPSLYLVQAGNTGKDYLSRVTETVASKVVLENDQAIRRGYTFWLDSTASTSDQDLFFVNDRGYYQIPSDVKVSKLGIPNPDDLVTIEYVLHYRTTGATGSQVVSTSVEKIVVGQSRGIFSYDENLGTSIKRRHLYQNDQDGYDQELQWFKGICVDVDPYAILKVNYQDEVLYNTLLVGETGVLHFLKNSEINDLYFHGRKMKGVDRSIVKQGFAKPWEFAYDETPISIDDTESWHDLDGLDSMQKVRLFVNDAEYDAIADDWEKINDAYAEEVYRDAMRKATLADIKNPVRQMVYKVNDSYYLYYMDGNFYQFDYDKDDDGNVVTTRGTAHVPVQGYINYYGNVVRNNYN